MRGRPGKAMCTKCGSWDTLPSRKHSAIPDAFMGMFGKRAYRCHACRTRFYAVEPEIEFEESGGGRSTLHAGPRAAVPEEPGKPAPDPVKREDPRDAEIQAGGERVASGAAAVEPAMDAGDGEERLASQPAPGQPDEEREEVAGGEVPSVQELLSSVDRIIEAARTQKGPDAEVVAGQDESSANSAGEGILGRAARGLRFRKRPSEEDSVVKR